MMKSASLRQLHATARRMEKAAKKARVKWERAAIRACWCKIGDVIQNPDGQKATITEIVTWTDADGIGHVGWRGTLFTKEGKPGKKPAPYYSWRWNNAKVVR